MRLGRVWRDGVCAFNLGGRPTAVDDMPEHRPLMLLRDSGFEVHAVARGTARERFELDGIVAWVEPSTARMAGRIAALRPELLFVETNAYGPLLWELARRRWIRNPQPAAHPQVRRLQRAAVRRFDAVSFTNPVARDAWTFSADRYVDLAYPLDLAWWSTPVPRRDAFWTERERTVPGGPVIVSIASYTRDKRVSELIEEVAPFLTANRSSTLVLVGHQLVEPEVTEMIRARPAVLGIAEQVIITGWMSHDDIRELLGWASVLIVNSRRETQCLAIYEALAAGVPVLIYANPVLTSQFPRLPAHENGEELRSNLEQVLANPALGAALVESTRERLAWADVHRHDQVFYEALERLLGRRSG